MLIRKNNLTFPEKTIPSPKVSLAGNGGKIDNCFLWFRPQYSA